MVTGIGPRGLGEHRRAALHIGMAALLLLPWLTLARPVAACSCVEFPGFAAVADDEHLVVAGHVVARDSGRATIQVDRWLWGPGRPPLVTVQEADPQADMCALGPLAPLGKPWLWVAFVAPDAVPVINACQPSWSLTEREGEKRMIEALAAFGAVPTFPSPSDAPAPASDVVNDAGILDGATATLLPVVAGLLVLGTAVVVARRPRRRRQRS